MLIQQRTIFHFSSVNNNNTSDQVSSVSLADSSGSGPTSGCMVICATVQDVNIYQLFNIYRIYTGRIGEQGKGLNLIKSGSTCFSLSNHNLLALTNP